MSYTLKFHLFKRKEILNKTVREIIISIVSYKGGSEGPFYGSYTDRIRPSDSLKTTQLVIVQATFSRYKRG